MRFRNAKRPIMKPSGMPTSAARPKPSATRCSENRMFQPMPWSFGPVAVERVGEQLHRRVEGGGRRREGAALHRQQRPDADQQAEADQRRQAPAAASARQSNGMRAARRRGARRCGALRRRGAARGLTRALAGAVDGRGGLKDGADHVHAPTSARVVQAVDLEAVGVLGRVLAVPDHAVDQLAAAQVALRHADLQLRRPPACRARSG